MTTEKTKTGPLAYSVDGPSPQLRVRVHAHTYVRIKWLAKRAGLSVSEWVRRRLGGQMDGDHLDMDE